jgi:hypothetical protein
MERVAWTDERLNDLSQRMDLGFERVDRDIRDLRGEMHVGFAEVRSEMHAGFAEARSEIDSLRSLMFRMNAGVSVVAAALLHGI